MDKLINLIKKALGSVPKGFYVYHRQYAVFYCELYIKFPKFHSVNPRRVVLVRGAGIVGKTFRQAFSLFRRDSNSMETRNVPFPAGIRWGWISFRSVSRYSPVYSPFKYRSTQLLSGE